MSPKHRPLTCREIKSALKTLGFEERPRKSGTSHEHYVGTFRGEFRKVTVDCPKSPFSPILIGFMAKQAGVSKTELYNAVDGRKPSDWP